MALGKVGSPSHTRRKQSFRKNATSWKPRFSFSAIRLPRTQRHRKSPLQRRGLRWLRANWLLQIRHCLKHLSCDAKEAPGASFSRGGYDRRCSPFVLAGGGESPAAESDFWAPQTPRKAERPPRVNVVALRSISRKLKCVVVQPRDGLNWRSPTADARIHPATLRPPRACWGLLALP